jgi:hypothetical protein
VDNLYFSTFHGGSSADWAPTVDCFTWFDDIVVSTHRKDVVATTTEHTELAVAKSVLNIPTYLKSNEKYKLGHVKQSIEVAWYDKTGKCVAKGQQGNELQVPALVPSMYILKYVYEGKAYEQSVWVE